jgi:hypothetical protein
MKTITPEIGTYMYMAPELLNKEEGFSNSYLFTFILL